MGLKRTIKKPPHETRYENMSNAASTVGASLQGKFEEMGSFRLAVAKYSLVQGIPYKVETSIPDEYKAVRSLARGNSPDEQRRICSFHTWKRMLTRNSSQSLKEGSGQLLKPRIFLIMIRL
jgi:hypothetical protein